MSSCQSQGRPDLYGLGIRLGIYLQWLGEVIIEYVDDVDVADVRLLGLVLPGAVILALIVNVARHDIQPADIYISLQLSAGSYVFLIPIYVWRTLTCCSRTWDPLVWTSEVSIPIFSISTLGLIITTSALGIWFFTTYLPTRADSCEQYGFLFTKISLGSSAYVAVNVAVYVCIILVCLGKILVWTGYWDGRVTPERRRRRRRRQRRHRQRESAGQDYGEHDDEYEQTRRHQAEREHVRREQKDLLRTMRGISNLTVYGLHIAAIELTIRWNGIDNVDGVDTSAQTIPLLLSLGFLFRTIISQYSHEDDINGDLPAGIAEPVSPDPTRPSPETPQPYRSRRYRQPYQMPTVTEFPENISDMEMDDVSANFVHGTNEYWLARMRVAAREAAQEAEVAQAAQEFNRGARVIPRRPTAAHFGGVTVL